MKPATITASVAALEGDDRRIAEGRNVQWDYRNIVKRKGRLERLK